ncbi:AAA family ATPase [Rhodococcus opacus]|uniref:AAA family ATPase n=1 Tax=Rhodococcus opacus TaxID=37919 RepID=UPI0007CD956F|nr:AAA family ATPase [Rhodococcus opacus]
MTADEGCRRRLVTVAVRGYPYEPESFRSSIDAQVSALTEWLTAPALGERAFEHQLLNPMTRDAIEDFVRQARLRELGVEEVLVLYITGHGIRGGSGHFLLLPNSDEDRPLTGYRTSDLLAAVLGSDADHVLVLVDSCHAGALISEWGHIREDLPKHRRDLPTLRVLASADFDEKPRIGEFAKLLNLVYERLCKHTEITGRHLSFDQLLTEIAAVRQKHRELGRPIPVWAPGGTSPEESLCLPNPGFKPSTDLVEPPRRQVAVTTSDLEEWVSRASGRVDPGERGWYFSGRTALNEAVVSFLRAGEGLLVITGVAGSGKSAVLARAVTLSDPTFIRNHADLMDGIDARTMPPEGSIDAAVSAREQDTEQVCADLIEALGGIVKADGGRVLDQLREHLTAEGARRTLVVDGVDEALHPDRLIAEFLGPLGNLRTADGTSLVRLLLGLRSAAPAQRDEHDGDGQGLLDLLRRSTGELPLDLRRTDNQPAVTDDIAEYVASLLRGRGAYGKDISAITPVVTTVAEKVTPSFLDARIAGKQLREAAELQDLEDPEWLSTLADGTASLFRSDLAHVATAVERSVDHILAVLRATAFALGRGLPRSQVWPAIAAALADSPMPEADQVIDSVLHSRLSGYLYRDVEDGRVVYRPNHERLAEALRDDTGSLTTMQPTVTSPARPRLTADGAQVHRRITIALADLIDPSELPPHPYLRRHLIEHAYRGDVLDDNHIPSAFLPWEQGSRVHGMLGLPPPVDASSSRLAIWASIEPYLGEADIASRRASLAFACAAAGLHPESDAERKSNRLFVWTGLALVPVWARWRLPPGNVLTVLDRAVQALTTLTLRSGRVLLASGGSDGIVRLWDLQTSTSAGDPLTAHRGSVQALTTLTLRSGRVLLASGGSDGIVRLWDPQTGKPVRKLLTGSFVDGMVYKLLGGREMVLALTTVTLPRGRVLLASSSADGKMALWDPETGKPAGDPLKARRGGEQALTTATLPSGRVLLASGGSDGIVRLWDPQIGKPAAHRRIFKGDAVRSLTALKLPNGRVLLATGDYDGTVRLWDPETGKPARDPFTARRGSVQALTTLTLRSGRVLLVIGNLFHGSVELWDPETGKLARELVTQQGAWAGMRKYLTGIHVGNIGPALTALTLPSGKVLLAAGGSDGTVRLWDPQAWRSVRKKLPTGQTGSVEALTTLTLPSGRVLLAVGRSDGTVQLWDPETGKPAGDPLTGHTGWVEALTTLTLPSGRVLLAVGRSDGTVQLWDPETGKPAGDPLTGHTGGVQALTTLTLPSGKVLLAVGDSDGTVRLWDPETGVEALRLVTGRAVTQLTGLAIDARCGLAIGGMDGVACLTVDDGTADTSISPP